MPRTPTQTTTQRGLGHDHRKVRAVLFRRHIDGSPCPCNDDPADPCGPACPCRVVGRGLPRWKDATLNVDLMPLEADHTRARSRGGTKADRLLIATCNRSRGAGRTPTAQPTAHPWWSRQWY